MSSKKVSGFNALISNQEILKYLKSVSIFKPTPVQKKSIKPFIQGGNYSVQGRTGSGKTLAYLLPIIEKLKEFETQSSEDLVAHPKVVILLPTRELALQVFSVTKEISHFAKLRVRKLVGGDKGKSLQGLFKSKIDILVTTPDRCLRAFRNKELKSSSLKYFVYDEADQLLEPSFRKTVSAINDSISNHAKNIFLVSATMPLNFDEIISEFFPERKFTFLGQDEQNTIGHNIKTFNHFVEEDDKFFYVKGFVKRLNNTNGLIFTGNKARAHKLNEVLLEEKSKKPCYLLHKDLEVKERKKIVEDFKATGGILVATDIFARGIDLNHLEWVLNFDIPSDADYYLHRSGRVGRAGRSGNVFNFITSRDGKRKNRINETLVNQGRRDLRISTRKTF